MDMNEIQSIVETTFETVSSEMVPEDIERVRDHMTIIVELIASVDKVFGDGLQWDDITHIGEIVSPLMKLASSFYEYEGLDKKRFVIEVMWLVYRTIDTYPDGNRNNINIPLAIGVWERRIERAVISLSVGMAVEALYKRMKANGEV